jgi:hypothetical protein
MRVASGDAVMVWKARAAAGRAEKEGRATGRRERAVTADETRNMAAWELSDEAVVV